MPTPLLMLSAALLPALLLWLYIYWRDPQKEPLAWLLASLALGIMIAPPAAGAESFISGLLFGEGGEGTSLIGSTAEAFLVAALPEESLKLLALWLVLRRNPHFDEHFDGIVYAVSIGLGFAAIENVLYLFTFAENWQAVAWSRAFLAVPGHYAFAVLMGYYYSIYHFVDPSPRRAANVLLVPVLAHGIYDTLAMSGQVNPLLGAISFFFLIYFCIKMQRFCQQRVVELMGMDEGTAKENPRLP